MPGASTSGTVSLIGERQNAGRAPHHDAHDWGGQLFITVALLERLNTDEQLAAVVSHEVGHVIARHALPSASARRSLTGGSQPHPCTPYR